MRIKTNDKSVSIELKNLYKELSEKIILSSILKRVYADKISKEIVNTKVNNQLNSMEVSINRINPKFEKSKNYIKVKEEMIETLDSYEQILKYTCNEYDKKIEDLILKNVELESKLLMAILSRHHFYNKNEKTEKKSIVKGITTVVEKIKNKVSKKEQLDISLIHRLKDGQDIEAEFENYIEQSDKYKENEKYIKNLKKEIKELNKKINNVNDEKTNKVFSAMETADKALTTQIRKPKTFKKITKFFANKFNTYNVVMKTVIEPVKQRMDEFKVNDLKKVDIKFAEMDFVEIEAKIKSAQLEVLDDTENKLLCKKMGILENE